MHNSILYCFHSNGELWNLQHQFYLTVNTQLLREIIYTKEKEEKIDQQKDNFVLNPDRVFQRLGVLSITMNYCSN